MKVKVISQEVDHKFFSENLVELAFSNLYENIEIGKYYVVQAIVFWKNIPFYYIYEYDDDFYPKPICYKYFEVVDESFPRCWRLVVDEGSGGHCQSFLVFGEWADSLDMYERLIDGDEQALKIFKKYKNLLG
ncbi:hypothetical protein [Acidovorax sp. LjRoot117]|uniref:hypothetical protein n=1 Tax=Acidovorax sp. LjRoot117 TaxID=3342255 RepID=UPI003ECD21AC